MAKQEFAICYEDATVAIAVVNGVCISGSFARLVNLLMSYNRKEVDITSVVSEADCKHSCAIRACPRQFRSEIGDREDD